LAKLVGFVVVVATAVPACAAEQPDAVRKVIQEAERQCRSDGGRPHQGPKFARVEDLNRDGGEDWILDYAHFECRGAIPPLPLCGSGGCTLTIFLWSGGSTWKRAFDDLVQAHQFVRVNGRRVLQADFAGAVCGKANVETCRKLYRFQGSDLVPAR
jgi:hypothetical protein